MRYLVYLDLIIMKSIISVTPALALPVLKTSNDGVIAVKFFEYVRQGPSTVCAAATLRAEFY